MRWRMIEMACSSVSLETSFTGLSTTDTPPWRSSPRRGLLPTLNV